MKRLNSLCIISDNYPRKDNQRYVFVGELVKAISSRGVRCTVICGGSKNRDIFWVDHDLDGNEIPVFQAFIPSFGLKRVGPNALTYYYRDLKYSRLFEKSGCRPDALYAHFWHVGIAAAKIAEKARLPLVVATGESRIFVNEVYRKDVLQHYKRYVNGMISVSSENREVSVGMGLIDDNRSIVVPNAINNNLFRKMSKEQCRKELSIDNSDFVVAFVGAFISRKGPLRLAEAVERVGGIKTIYIGTGEQKPEGRDVLFCGQLSHELIPLYLNAADAFVLPTRREGCCNAIVEAMACGLPIVSSNGKFNDDILNDKNSIRVDSDNIDQIAQAIQRLKQYPELRESMSKESLRIAADLTLDRRADRIINAIERFI